MSGEGRSAAVITQSMYFPWVGMLEQIRLASVYIRYDDVQFTKNSFTRRVQIKSDEGVRWLTVPLRNLEARVPICEVEIDNTKDWKRAHRDILRAAYKDAPHVREMLDLVDGVFANAYQTIGDLGFVSTRALAAFFGIDADVDYKDSRDLHTAGSGSERIFDLVRAVGCNRYITGHGAKNYLDHEHFERNDVEVCYLDYLLTKYPQLHGEFTPFVSALDLVANCGKNGSALIASDAVPWREFLRPDPPGGTA